MASLSTTGTREINTVREEIEKAKRFNIFISLINIHIKPYDLVLIYESYIIQ